MRLRLIYFSLMCLAGGSGLDEFHVKEGESQVRPAGLSQVFGVGMGSH